MKDSTKDIIWYSTIVLVMIVAYMLFWYTPYMIDDVWYGDIFMRDYNRTGTFADWWQGVRTNFIFRITEDNGRIPNLFGSALITLPNWLMSLILTLCLGATLLIGSLIIGRRRASLLAFGIWTAGTIFIEPWYDGMYTRMFALNYLPTTALTLALLYFILHDTIRKPWLIVTAGFLGSLWNESLMFTLLGGIIGITLCFKQYRTRNIVLWTAGLVLACVYYFSIPCTYVRMDRQFHWYGLYQFWRGALISVPFYILVISVGLGLMFKATRKRLFTPELAFIFGGALAAWVLFRCYMNCYRVTWQYICLVSLGMAYIANQLIRPSRLTSAAGLVLLAASIIQPAFCMPWVLRLREEEGIMRKLGETYPDSTGMFSPQTTSRYVPLHTLNRICFNLVYIHGDTQYRNFIPDFLLDFNPEKCRDVGRGLPVYHYKGEFIIPGECTSDIGKYDVTLHYTDGASYYEKACVCGFTNDAGHFQRILIHEPFFSAKCRTIENVEIQPACEE